MRRSDILGRGASSNLQGGGNWPRDWRRNEVTGLQSATAVVVTDPIMDFFNTIRWDDAPF